MVRRRLDGGTLACGRTCSTNGSSSAHCASVSIVITASDESRDNRLPVKRFRRYQTLELVKQLRQCNARMRIVVVTDADSFASVVLALRAGADDYLAQPADDGELIDALLDRAPMLPPVPDTPLGLGRTCWEHIMRLHEQCGCNVTHTAQRLGMQRRSLQRILGKRAPPPRPLQR